MPRVLVYCENHRLDEGRKAFSELRDKSDYPDDYTVAFRSPKNWHGEAEPVGTIVLVDEDAPKCEQIEQRYKDADTCMSVVRFGGVKKAPAPKAKPAPKKKAAPKKKKKTPEGDGEE